MELNFCAWIINFLKNIKKKHILTMIYSTLETWAY